MRQYLDLHDTMLLALIQNYFQALLQLLGYSRPGPQPSKPALRSPGEGGGEKGRKVGVIMFCCRMIMLVRISAHEGIEIIDFVDACIKVTRPRPVPVSVRIWL